MKNNEIGEIKEEIQENDAALFKKAGINRLGTLGAQIEKGFSEASDAYFAIGSALWMIHHNGYYRINGFKNIEDYAYERFGLGRSTSNDHIRVIYRSAGIDGGKVLGIREDFKAFSCSQLVQERYRITITLRNMSGYLKRWGMTCQRPAKKENYVYR